MARRLVTPPSLARAFSSTETLDLSSLRGRSLLRTSDLSPVELHRLLLLSFTLRRVMATPAGRAWQPLLGRSMAMIFQKRSTRTRVSTETGIAALGGHALMLAKEDIQLGVNESVRDTATVLSGYNDVILARVYAHDDVLQLAKYSTVPVINALSDAHHPLQLLADLATIQLQFGRLAGVKVAWIGDGNNVLNGFLDATPLVGLDLRIATPRGYEPHARVLAEARAAIGKAHVGRLLVTHDPAEALAGADVVVTDTWVSMGQEADTAKRVQDFKGFQVTNKLVETAGASPDWIFMHCLPRKPYEVDDDVFYSTRSQVWNEAAFRKWTVMAVTLAQLLGKVTVPAVTV